MEAKAPGSTVQLSEQSQDKYKDLETQKGQNNTMKDSPSMDACL